MNKGEVVRSRWVVKHFKNTDSEERFAAIPAVEALRALVSDAVTREQQKGLMV